jgi:hypothetical protein
MVAQSGTKMVARKVLSLAEQKERKKVGYLVDMLASQKVGK